MNDNPHPPLTDLQWLEITYETRDRFGIDQDSDPNHRYVQGISGKIEGLFEDLDQPVELGTLRLAKVDLFEASGHRLLEALDAESEELAHYLDVVDEGAQETHLGLLILDRIELVPWARGHGIGLHVLARAIRTWSDTDCLVVLTAHPPGVTGQQGRAGAAKLARYWAQLGLKRVKGTSPSILTGATSMRAVDDRVRQLSASLRVAP